MPLPRRNASHRRSDPEPAASEPEHPIIPGLFDESEPDSPHPDDAAPLSFPLEFAGDDPEPSTPGLDDGVASSDDAFQMDGAQPTAPASGQDDIDPFAGLESTPDPVDRGGVDYSDDAVAPSTTGYPDSGDGSTFDSSHQGTPALTPITSDASTKDDDAHAHGDTVPAPHQIILFTIGISLAIWAMTIMVLLLSYLVLKGSAVIIILVLAIAAIIGCIVWAVRDLKHTRGMAHRYASVTMKSIGIGALGLIVILALFLAMGFTSSTTSSIINESGFLSALNTDDTSSSSNTDKYSYVNTVSSGSSTKSIFSDKS